MTSTMRGAAWTVLLLGLAAPLSWAQDLEPGASASSPLLAPGARVRAVDAAARRVFEAAVACSPTVERMVTSLQSSDLIVGIETAMLPKKVNGEMRVVAATGSVRYVRVRLGVPAGFQDLVAILGHELHHAIEVAAAPGVRDQASQARHYVEAGYPVMHGGYFETAGALETGRQVAREVTSCRMRD